MGGRKWTDLCKCFTGFPACSRHTHTDTSMHTHTHSRIYINYINAKGQIRKNRSHVRAVPGGMIDDWLGFVFGEAVGFKLFDRRDSWPVLLCRCSWSHIVTYRLPCSIKQVITCGETSELLKRSDLAENAHPVAWRWGGARLQRWSRGTEADLQPSHRIYIQHPWRHTNMQFHTNEWVGGGVNSFQAENNLN